MSKVSLNGVQRFAASGVMIISVLSLNLAPFIANAQEASSTPPDASVTGPVADTTPPVITLTGDATIHLAVGDAYADAGATATDDTDSSVTVNSEGAVDTSAAGTYTITYSAVDAAGNAAAPVERTVIVSLPVSDPASETGTSTEATTTDATTTDPGTDTGDNAPKSLFKTLAVQEPEPASCTFVSDEDTQVDDHDSAIQSFIHSSWTHLLDAAGAKWIWSEDGINDPVGDTTKVFTKTMHVTGTPSSASLDMAADNGYIVSVNGHEVANHFTEEFNYTGTTTIAIPVGDLIPDADNTFEFTVKNFAMSGGTPQTNPAGLDYVIHIDGSECTPPDNNPPKKTATIVATKIVCDSESDLPNLGGSNHVTDADTASAFLETHPSCHAEPGWMFDWGDQNAGDSGDTATGTYSGYTAFPEPTDDDGVATATVPLDDLTQIHVREELQDGYIPFTHQAHPDNSDTVSAELSCGTDGLNYDNWDFITDPQDGATYYCVAYNAPTEHHAPDTSTVTMCKFDNSEHPLAGWQLWLKGEHAGTVAVNPDGSEYSLADVPAGNYLLTASGTYTYRPNDPTASTSDAAYSLRLPGDSTYGNGPYTPWSRENDTPTPYTGWLGIMLNDSFTDWGSVFHSDHIYALATTTASQEDFDFKILDDQYNDNSGSLSVDVDHGYTGTTGENGCITFNNVPYGTYTAGEFMQDGWEYVSGAGTVTVDEPEETFTIVNKQEGGEQPSSVRVHIFKYLDNGEAGIEQIPNDSNAPDFPMKATYDIAGVGTNLDPGDDYVLGDGGGIWGSDDGLQYAANTRPLSTGDTYGTHEVVGGDSPVVESKEQCAPGKYYLEGYKTGTSLENAQNADITSDAPNYDPITQDEYVIVVNAPCDNGGDNGGDHGGTLTIVKKTLGGDGTFNFTVAKTNSEESGADYSLTTAQASATSSAIALDADTPYNVTEDVPEGWTLTNVSCDYDEESEEGTSIENGETISVGDGEDITCTFTNTNETDNVNNTVIVRSGDLATDAADAATNPSKWFFLDDQAPGFDVDNTKGSFVSGPGTPPLGSGSAEITATTTQGIALDTLRYNGTRLSDITTLQYSTYRSEGDPALALALQFDVDNDSTDSNHSYMGRLIYEPYYTQAVSSDAWQTWNALDDGAGSGAGNWWFSNGTLASTSGCTQADPCTWAQVRAVYPNASISGSTDFKAGSNWASDFTGNVDKFIIGTTDGTTTTTTTYDFEPDEVVPKTIIHHSGGGGNGKVLGATTEGQVLGASCEPLLTTFMKMGWASNTVDEVTKLQNFLNTFMHSGLPVTGYFGPLTEAAVRNFQLYNAGDVLVPWIGVPDSGITSATTPTGYVYKTTQWKINMINCPDLNLPFPEIP